MLKDEHKILLISLAGGVSLWIIDALIDSVLLSQGSFWTLLAAGGKHEIYIFLASFAIFGLLASRFIRKRRHLEKELMEKEKRYRALFESAGDAIFVLEAEGEQAGRILSANPAAATMHGYTVDELLALNIRDLDAKDDAALAASRIQRVMRGEWIKEEIRHVRKDGTVFPVEISAGMLELDSRRYILAFDRDITARTAVEKALKESEDKYRSLMESVGDSIYLVDREYRYLFMNKKHVERLGVGIDHFLGQAYGSLHSSEETREFVAAVDRVVRTGETVRQEHLSQRDNRYFLRTLSPVSDADGGITAVTVVSKDITDLKLLEERLRALSLTDDLTGLYNRRGFFAMVEQMMKLVRRERRGVFLLYADLDNLKEINDTMGHQEGDRALIDAANIFKATYRESDIVARMGGDEFVVIPVGHCGDATDAIIARFKKNVREHNETMGRKYHLSVSVGIAHYDPASSCAVEELLRQAEKEMYREKAGKQSP